MTLDVAAPVLKSVGFGPEGPIDGTWAAREQRRIGDVKPGSSFAIAQGIGMGEPVPWYGCVYGGLFSGALALLAFGLYKLVMLAYRRISRRPGHRFHPLPKVSDDNNPLYDKYSSFV